MFRGQRKGEIGLTVDEIRIIRTIRAVRGLSQLDLAVRSGVSLSVISRLEKCTSDEPTSEKTVRSGLRPEDLISVRRETIDAIFDALETDTVRIQQVNHSIKVTINDVASSGYFLGRAKQKHKRAG